MHISLFVRVNAQLQFFMRRLLFQLTFIVFIQETAFKKMKAVYINCFQIRTRSSAG